LSSYSPVGIFDGILRSFASPADDSDRQAFLDACGLTEKDMADDHMQHK